MDHHPLAVQAHFPLVTDPGSRIPFEEFSSAGLPLHFAHANGYPPRAYLPLLEHFTRQYQVLAMYQRQFWPGSDSRALVNWEPFAADLSRFLDEQGLSKIPGIGHSLGGTTTLRLALRQPERFSAVVLLDPVLFPPALTPLWSRLFNLGLTYHMHPLARATLRRRRAYPDRQAIFASYRQKEVFARLEDRELWAYVDAISTDRQDNQVELIISPEWESRIYVTAAISDQALWRDLPGLKPPLLVIRGKSSNTFYRHTARLMRKKLPAAVFVDLPQAGHLVPLEQSQQVAAITLEFLQIHLVQ
jgi:pimeloyl-ACP methyl ester carboxylesterase